jgi:hypothetical protein
MCSIFWLLFALIFCDNPTCKYVVKHFLAKIMFIFLHVKLVFASSHGWNVLLLIFHRFSILHKLDLHNFWALRMEIPSSFPLNLTPSQHLFNGINKTRCRELNLFHHAFPSFQHFHFHLRSYRRYMVLNKAPPNIWKASFVWRRHVVR